MAQPYKSFQQYARICDRIGKDMTEEDLHKRIIAFSGVENFDKIFEKTRKREIFNLRMILAHWYRRQGLTLYQIGDKLNKAHHVAYYYIKNFGINYEYSKDFRKLADEILKE